MQQKKKPTFPFKENETKTSHRNASLEVFLYENSSVYNQDGSVNKSDWLDNVSFKRARHFFLNFINMHSTFGKIWYVFDHQF